MSNKDKREGYIRALRACGWTQTYAEKEALREWPVATQPRVIEVPYCGGGAGVTLRVVDGSLQYRYPRDTSDNWKLYYDADGTRAIAELLANPNENVEDES